MSSLSQLKTHVVTIDGYADVAENDEKKLLQAVATQPVSVGISGSERAFQLYSKVWSSSHFQYHCPFLVITTKGKKKLRFLIL